MPLISSLLNRLVSDKQFRAKGSDRLLHVFIRMFISSNLGTKWILDEVTIFTEGLHPREMICSEREPPFSCHTLFPVQTNFEPSHFESLSPSINAPGLHGSLQGCNSDQFHPSHSWKVSISVIQWIRGSLSVHVKWSDRMSGGSISGKGKDG